jgi:hypothetical protein
MRSGVKHERTGTYADTQKRDNLNF